MTRVGLTSHRTIPKGLTTARIGVSGASGPSGLGRHLNRRLLVHAYVV